MINLILSVWTFPLAWLFCLDVLKTWIVLSKEITSQSVLACVCSVCGHISPFTYWTDPPFSTFYMLLLCQQHWLEQFIGNTVQLSGTVTEVKAAYLALTTVNIVVDENFFFLCGWSLTLLCPFHAFLWNYRVDVLKADTDIQHLFVGQLPRTCSTVAQKINVAHRSVTQVHIVQLLHWGLTDKAFWDW